MSSQDEPVDMPDYPPMDESGWVDLTQIKANLALTPAQRMKQFEGFLELAAAMREAGRKYYGDLPAIDSQTP